MKIVYIANLNLHVKGGLFKATFERISRVKEQVDDVFVINNNFYDSAVINLVKKVLNRKDSRLKKPDISTYKNVEINNTNFKRTIFFYFKRVLKLKSTENGMIRHYLKHYKEELERADIIHAHFGWVNGYIAYELSRQLNKPYFITLHGSDVNKVWKHNRSRLVEAMEQAERCFFVSSQLLEQAITLGYSGKNALITYNGVDTKLFSQKDKRNYNRVGFVGTLKKVKGADLLPDIFKCIEKYNGETDFFVIGDGPLRNQLEQAFKERDLDVEMPGLVDYDDVPELLKTMDVLVVPSRNEGLGMIALEANAMGIPAVGSAVGGIPEAISFEENLIAFTDDLPELMGSRVAEILSSESDSSRYRERVLAKFDWDKIVDIETAAYVKALNKNQYVNP
ncbi:glycosyltransferase [Alkalibacterium kapii]|uniref:Glycosyl transferase group 1 n=1 Tax=Alkalibacterium kapii TaxID=426704 RepID=A0A511AS71_9LACT|nr:glycosyltransferase [Alkalibacterium kapii]GEK91050.1 glycosyl transferase group 1 [Alkalibacterium kapii]